MKTVLVGSQTGNKEDYDLLRELCDEGTILVDDTNPLELAAFVQEKRVDLFIGGVKERPHRVQAGHRLLRPQPRAQGRPGRLRGDGQLRRRGPRLDDEPGLAVRPDAAGRAGRGRGGGGATAGVCIGQGGEMRGGGQVMQELPVISDPPAGFAATRNACNVCTPLAPAWSSGGSRGRSRSCTARKGARRTSAAT